jgi:hypothetical protein
MMSDPFQFRPFARPLVTPEYLEGIRQRIADGIFLGGDYHSAYEQYLTAHRDRCALLALLDEKLALLAREP